jgi:GxxExxY protein
VHNDYRDDSRNNHRSGRQGGRAPRNDGRFDGRMGGGERRGIPLSDLDPRTTEASRRVIGCAIEVHKALGPGFDAPIYLQALKCELEAQGVPFTPDHRIPVIYKDKTIGEVTAHLFVEGLFLVEVSARAGQVSTPERLALRARLKAANLDLGLVINFAERRLKDGLVRVLNIDKINQDKGLSAAESHDEDLDHAEGDRLADFDHQ